MTRSGRKIAAVVVAGGAGSRAGQGGPKQWRRLAGRPVASWSLEALSAWGAAPLVLVHPAAQAAEAAEAAAGLPGVRFAAGGATRTDSVRAGLEGLAPDEADIVLIHDAARPFLAARVLDQLAKVLEHVDAAAPALAVADTLKRATAEGMVLDTADRDGLWRVQTPQAFRRKVLADALAALPEKASATDDLALVEAAGARVQLTPGDPMLLKLTYPEDFEMAERLARAARHTRVGQGFDAHRFGPGDGVWLCGVKIAADRTLIGHSDADAGLHALTDAVLGALGEGDIGDHFPPSDPKWRGAASDQFLLHALALAAARGARLINVDVTLICEAPRIKPHREAMRIRLAEICGLPLDRVSIKATTTERMGFTGREEGLAAQALAVLEHPA
jgi:2-C-methyl-D-erythritol 4-phosphate cytidylyltransferase / 2-C-methyl-D-erythritol 2,4-cyclodiphosphate synthase